MTEHHITLEQCRRLIQGVCPRCGGEPQPIETEDNGGNPTFLAACCGHFTWGVDPEVQRIAAELVADGYESQTAGACRIVAKVLALHRAGRPLAPANPEKP